MKKNTVIFLAIVAAGLFAYIMAFERGSLSTSEVRGRASSALPRLVRERVTKLELRHGEESIVLERDREDEDELGNWRLTSPVSAEADNDAVDSLLSAMEFLEPRRRLEELSDSDLHELGFDAPRHRLWFTAGNERVEVQIGGDDARGEGVYMRAADERRAFVVGRDFVEAIDHDAAHFRKKDLFPDFRTRDVVSLRLSRREEAGGEEEIRIEREEGRFRIASPDPSFASASATEDILSVLRELVAARFVAEGARHLERYGLDAPYRELRAERPEEITEHRTARLRIGGPCEDHEGERYAIGGDAGPVVCVRETAIAALDVALERLRERRLITVRDDEAQHVDIAAGGRRLILRREGEGWKLQLREGEDRSGADDEAVSRWLEALRGLRVAEFLPATEESLAAHGLAAEGDARATLLIERGEEEGSERLTLGLADESGIYLRREQEPAIVRLDPSPEVEPLFSASPLRFRDRRVIRDLPDSAQRFTIRRGALTERVARSEGSFLLEAPIAVEADRVAARELARRVATLRAERYVAEAPAPEHGLAEPRLVATVRFEGPSEPEEMDPEGEEGHGGQEGQEGQEGHESRDPAPREVELRIGAATEGGAFAQVGTDGAVFVVSESLVRAIEGPLVSRDLLSIDTEAVTRVELAQAGAAGATVFRRDGLSWQTGDGEAAEQERISALLDRLSTLRASGVEAYGAPAPELGLTPPAHRVTVERSTAPEGEEATLRMQIGEPQGEGEERWFPVRREGLDVTFRFRPEAVQPFLPR